jgi:hypothetical protein
MVWLIKNPSAGRRCPDSLHLNKEFQEQKLNFESVKESIFNAKVWIIFLNTYIILTGSDLTTHKLKSLKRQNHYIKFPAFDMDYLCGICWINISVLLKFIKSDQFQGDQFGANFRLVGDCLLWAVFFITVSAHIFGNFFHGKSCVLMFTINGQGYIHFMRFFHEIIRHKNLKQVLLTICPVLGTLSGQSTFFCCTTYYIVIATLTYRAVKVLLHASGTGLWL